MRQNKYPAYNVIHLFFTCVCVLSIERLQKCAQLINVYEDIEKILCAYNHPDLFSPHRVVLLSKQVFVNKKWLCHSLRK